MTTYSLVLPELGLTLAAYEGGNPAGLPLLFIHGNSLAADIFAAQFDAPELQEFRLVSFDLPGHGQSVAAPSFYRPASMAQVIVEAAHALRCEQALATGHSYGGHLLLDALPSLPALRGLLTIGTPPVSTPEDIARAFQFDDTAALFYTATLTADQAERLARHILRPNATAAEMARLVAAITRADGRFRADTGAAIAAGDLADEVAHVRSTHVPLAFALGEYENIVHSSYYKQLTAPTRWEQPLHVLPGTAHLPFLEDPAAFNHLLLRFHAALA